MTRSAAALLLLLAVHSAASGQYRIDTYAGRQGPKPGTPLLDAYLDTWGLTIGPNGNVYYYSLNQLVELDLANSVIGRVYSPADLPFKGDFLIDAITVDVHGNIYLLDDTGFRVLRIAPDGTMALRSIPPEQYTKVPGQIAADSKGNVYWTGSSRELQRLDFSTGATDVVLGDPGCYEETPVACMAVAVAVDPRDDTLYFLVGSLLRKRDPVSHELSTVVDLTGKFDDYEWTPNLVAAPDGTLLLPANLGIYRINPDTGSITAIGGGKKIYTGDLWLPTRRGVAQDANGVIYFTNPERIATIDDASGKVTPVAGNGQRNFTALPAPMADLQFTSDSWGHQTTAAPDGTLFVTEPSLYRIRIIDAANQMTWAVPNFPTGNISMAADRDGLLYFASGCQIKRMDARTGKVQAFLGDFDCAGFPSHTVEALAFDATRNNLYVLADSLKKVNIDSGEVTPVVDSATLQPVFPFHEPLFPGYFDMAQMAADSSGNLYIHRGGYGGIAKVTQEGVASLFVGDRSQYANGTGLLGETPDRLEIKDMAASTDGSALFILQGGSIQSLDLATRQMTKIAGSPCLELPLDSGNGGPALGARFSSNYLAVAGASIFIATQYGVRRVYPQADSPSTEHGPDSAIARDLSPPKKATGLPESPTADGCTGAILKLAYPIQN